MHITPKKWRKFAIIYVLVVFVLTATLLRSVIFGLILAYICLPLEKFLERKMLKASPFTGELKPRKVSFVKKIVRRIKRFIGNEEPLEATVDDPETHHRTSLVTRASTLTVALVTVLLIFVSVVLIVLSINYVSGIGHTVKNWTSEHAATESRRTPKRSRTPRTPPTPTAEEPW